jgi:hypothetical protein
MINEIISTRKFPPVLLLFGAEDFLVEQDARKLYDAACALDATGMNKFGCSAFDSTVVSDDVRAARDLGSARRQDVGRKG